MSRPFDAGAKPSNYEEYDRMLRIVTCGSNGDGKPTLIERLLQDVKIDFEVSDCDPGETTDITCRVFSTDKRQFTAFDTPGHEQNIPDMAKATSTADLAIMVVDARAGIESLTRQHSLIINLLGVKNLVLAVNKMDLVDYSMSRFDEIAKDYLEFAGQLGIDESAIKVIPVSITHGDNLGERSTAMEWYQGPTLMNHLETVPLPNNLTKPFRLPVQKVDPTDVGSFQFSGLVASGLIKPGDDVRVLPSGKTSKIASIKLARKNENDRQSEEVISDQFVSLVLADEVHVSPGDVICGKDHPAEVADQFRVSILWLDREAMTPGRTYHMKMGAKTVQATVAALKHKVDINSLEHIGAQTLELNSIGECNVALDQNIAFDAHKDNRVTGGFTLIDRMNERTVAMGTIHYALRRASNIHWQVMDVDEEARSKQKGQKPAVLWFTGLSGSGKSTIANALESKLVTMGYHTMLLDGDNVRHGLNRDLGFTEADRVENIRRVGEVSRLMVEAGLLTLVSFISPFRSERQMARERIADGQFLEIFVDTPLEIAEERDVKGLYKKARAGEIKNFTGIDSPYEEPEDPEIVINTIDQSPEEAATIIIDILQDRGVLKD